MSDLNVHKGGRFDDDRAVPHLSCNETPYCEDVLLQLKRWQTQAGIRHQGPRNKSYANFGVYGSGYTTSQSWKTFQRRGGVSKTIAHSLLNVALTSSARTGYVSIHWTKFQDGATVWHGKKTALGCSKHLQFLARIQHITAKANGHPHARTFPIGHVVLFLLLPVA